MALVLGWTVPIASTGVLSQLSYLAELFPWLDWVTSLPLWFVALLQGVLPQIALSVLMLIFPDVLRAAVKQRRLFTKTTVELTLQKYYFAFLFVHLFLTVSLLYFKFSVVKSANTEAPGYAESNLLGNNHRDTQFSRALPMF